MKNRLIIIISIALSIMLSACTNPAETLEKNSTKSVVCTTSMIGDMVENLVTPDFKVTTLMGPGVDPHLYKPTNNDIQALSKADIIVLNGLHLEGKMQEILEKLEGTKTIITIADGIEKHKLRSTSEFDGNYDPHIWFDASIWADCAAYTATELAKSVPEAKESLKKNSELTQQEYIILHEKIKTLINTIPENSKVLVTAHDAFSYFSLAYGIEVKALQGVSTSAEFGIKDVLELAEFLTSHNIKSVFVETSVSNKSLEKVLETCANKGHTVKIAGELFTDALGEKGTPEGTYAGMMEHNLNTIVENLK